MSTLSSSGRLRNFTAKDFTSISGSESDSGTEAPVPSPEPEPEPEPEPIEFDNLER